MRKITPVDGVIITLIVYALIAIPSVIYFECLGGIH